MKKIIIMSKTSVEVMDKILEPYGVTARFNEFDYKEMEFKEREEDFEDTFFDVMDFLAEKGIFVTVLNYVVQIGKNKDTAKFEDFTNYNHNRFSNYIERG